MPPGDRVDGGEVRSLPELVAKRLGGAPRLPTQASEVLSTAGLAASAGFAYGAVVSAWHDAPLGRGGAQSAVTFGVVGATYALFKVGLRAASGLAPDENPMSLQMTAGMASGTAVGGLVGGRSGAVRGALALGVALPLLSFAVQLARVPRAQPSPAEPVREVSPASTTRASSSSWLSWLPVQRSVKDDASSSSSSSSAA